MTRPGEVALLRRAFGFHELALEEVTKPHERPRCDAYAGYHFVVVYAVECAGKAFLPRELNLFWTDSSSWRSWGAWLPGASSTPGSWFGCELLAGASPPR